MFSGITNQFTSLVGAVKGQADEDVPVPPEGAPGAAVANVAVASSPPAVETAAAAAGAVPGEELAEGEEGAKSDLENSKSVNTEASSSKLNPSSIWSNLVLKEGRGWLGSAKGWLGNASIPSMPAMPSMPSMPAMPAMPAMPSMPSIPGLRKSEGGEEGAVPVEGAVGAAVSADEEDKSRYISATEGADSRPASGAGTPTGDEGQIGQVTTKVTQQAKHFGSFLSSAISKAGTRIKETVKDNTILESFNKEQEAFIKSQGGAGGNGGAPWIGHPNEAKIKEEILNLSQDRRNFVRAPPAGVEFDFSYETAYPTAIAIMAEDKALEAMRFDLVPKIIVEEEFWRNYFYRVSLIIQAAELGTLGADGVGQASSGEDVKTANETKNERGPVVKSVQSKLSVDPANIVKDFDPESELESGSVSQSQIKTENKNENEQRKTKTKNTVSKNSQKLSETDSEFVSDNFSNIKHESKDLAEIKDNMRKLGIDSLTTPFPTQQQTIRANSDDEEQWEKDLEAELNDFELIGKGGGGGPGAGARSLKNGNNNDNANSNGNADDAADDEELRTMPTGGRTRTRNNDFEEYADLLEDTDDLK